LLPAINAYLDSLKGPWPAQAIDLSQLGEFGSELLVEAFQSRGVRRATPNSCRGRDDAC
jgi:hypothetical protein